MAEATLKSADPAAAAAPRRFSRGGEFAAFCAQFAPWLGALWASLLVLVPPPGGADSVMPQASVFSWLLCASAIASAFFMWRVIRSGLRLGELSPVRLLIAGALPWALGLLLTPLALLQIWYFGIRQGASIDVLIEPAMAPRLTGLVLGSQLLGAAGFALAVMGFLWRSPGIRWPGLWRMLASLAPFAAFVIVWMVLDRATPLLVRAEWILFALLTLPLRYALAGAVVTRPPATGPGVEWALCVPLAGAVLFVAATMLYFDALLVGAAFATISTADGAEAWPNFTSRLSAAATFGLVGTVLVLLPQAVLLFRHHGRGSRLRQAALAHARILLLAGGLVLLEAVANWHVITTIRDAVLARPWAGPATDHVAPESGALRDSVPQLRPRKVKQLRPIEIPDRGVPNDFPPDSRPDFEPEPEPAGPNPETPALVIFADLAQGAIRRPELSVPEHLQSQMRSQNQTQAVIVMKLLVGEDGQVMDVVLQMGSGWPELDEHAIETAQDWLFRPYLVDGVPIAVASSWTINYRLQ